MINNVVMILDGQQRDSAIYIHVSILPKTPRNEKKFKNKKESSRLRTRRFCEI